ncbi:MAG: hypothetical protein OSJ76_09385 [Alphaproteobacteria bacterium]|nr:hypothetical protein [Alphaproteobacteria bacterium]
MKILKKLLEKLLILIFKIAVVISVITPVADALIDAAYAERGYSAIGGEWLLIIIITGAVWRLSGQTIKYFMTNSDRQKGDGKP